MKGDDQKAKSDTGTLLSSRVYKEMSPPGGFWSLPSPIQFRWQSLGVFDALLGTSDALDPRPEVFKNRRQFSPTKA